MADVRRSRRGPAIALGICVLVGVFLRLVQFADQRSLWMDEAALADSVVERSPADLLGRPLAYTQVAPPAFLLVSKGAVILLGPSESALRLLPLLSGVLFLLVFAAVAARLLAPVAAVAACALVALDAPHVYFSSEFKQYSTECLATVVLLWVAIRAIEAPGARRPRWLIAAGLITAVAGWFSYTAVLVAAAMFAALAATVVASRSRIDLRGFVAAGAIAACGLLPVVLHSRHSMAPRDQEHMAFAWTGGFAPLSPRALAVWLPKSIVEVAGFLTNLSGPAIALVLGLSLVGVLRLWKRDWRTGLCVVMPFAVAFGAAAVRLYPFKGERIALYLLPPAVLLVGAGLDGIAALRGSASRVAAAVLGAVLILPLGWRTVRDLPVRREELRPVLAEVAQRARPEDTLTVYYAAGPAFRFYRDRIPFRTRDVEFAPCHRDQWPLYLNDLATLSNLRRVWFIFSHYQVSVQGSAETAFLLDCLEKTGRVSERLEGKNALALLWEPAPDARDTLARMAAKIPPEHDLREVSWACIAGPQGPYQDESPRPRRLS